MVRRRRHARPARTCARSRSPSTTSPTPTRRRASCRSSTPRTCTRRSSWSARRSCSSPRSSGRSTNTAISSRTTRSIATSGAGSTRAIRSWNGRNSRFKREIGACPAWFRPPNGERTPFMARVVRHHGMRMAMWDVSAANGSRQSADDIVRRVLRLRARRFDHRPPRRHRRRFGRTARHSSQALPRILDGLRERSTSQPVRLDELVGGPAYTSCTRTHILNDTMDARVEASDDVPGGTVALVVVGAIWIVVLGVVPLAPDRVVVGQHEQLRARLVDRARISGITGTSRGACPCSVTAPRTRSRTASPTGRSAALLWPAARRLGRDARAPRSAPSVASSRRSSRFRSCGTAGGPRPCSPTPRSSRRCSSASRPSSGARRSCCSAWRAGVASAGSRPRCSSGSAQATHAADRAADRRAARARSASRSCPTRGTLLRWYALSLLIALPAVVLVFASPGYADSTTRDRLVNFVEHVGAALVRDRAPHRLCPHAPHAASAALAPLALVIALVVERRAPTCRSTSASRWAALTRSSSTASLDRFLASPRFVPGATYRVLRGAGDAKLGLYHVLRAGGRLDSEMFPESMAIRSFPSAADYEQLLCERHVDFVIAYSSYTASRHTNELAVLRRLAIANTVRSWRPATPCTGSRGRTVRRRRRPRCVTRISRSLDLLRDVDDLVLVLRRSARSPTDEPPIDA